MDDTNLSKKERRELKRQEELKQANREKRNRLIGRISLWTFVVVLVGGSIWGLAKLGTSNINSVSPAAQADTLLADPVTPSDWTNGNTDAKVTLVEYSDLQCPACAGAYPILKQLKAQYPNDVKIVYRHFPLPIHKHANVAARFAEAAGKQGKFWEMHDMLFEKQTDWSNSSKPEDKFVEYAQALSLNTDQLKADANSSEVAKAVNDDYSSGARSGVDSTPSFFFNGKRLLISSYNDLFAAVEAATKQ